MSIKKALKNMTNFFSDEKTEDCGDCMSELEIARLIDDKVNKRERQHFLNHLSQCTDCYHMWSETAALASSIEMEQTAGVQHPKATKQPFFDFSLFSPKIGIPAMGAIATVCLVVILWSGEKSYHYDIDTAYQQLAQQDHPLLKDIAGELAGFAQPNTMAFSKSEPQAYQKAFAAGLWEGRNTFLAAESESLPIQLMPMNDSSWSDSNWQYYYDFGKWSALVWVASQLPDSQVDWGELQNTINLVQAEFEKNNAPNGESDLAIAEINRLTPYLENIMEKNGKNKKALSEAISKAIAKLTPNS